MYRYKSIRNRRNINIDIYICESGRARYLMAIPDNMHDKSEMFVETYNSGGKQGNDYNDNIREAMSENGNTIESVLLDAIIDFPVIMPIIPDIIGLPDFQQLSLEAVRDYKIHEDFLKCIEDAKIRIQEVTLKNVQDKIFLHGYSSSGVFAQRIALIYPELIGRCLIGGACGTIPIPTTRIKYPIGIEDYEDIFGKSFDIEAYKKIKFGYYVGENEEKDSGEWDIEGEKVVDSKSQIRTPMHDMSFRSVSTPKEVGKKQRQLLGQMMNERFKKSIEANKRAGIDIEGIILRGADHIHIFDARITPTSHFLIEQLVNFYINNMQLNPNGKGCCKNLNESFQIARNMQNELEI